MHDFVYYNPTKVIMGRGVNPRIGDELEAVGAKKVLLHYGGGSIKGNGVYDEVTGALEAKGIAFAEAGGVKPNPVLSKARETIALARSEGVDAIVAIGGGSVIDSAKGVAAGARYDGDLWDFYAGRAKIASALPIFCVVTVSATASEMNFTSVLTNDEENVKVGLHSPHLYPRTTIIDPSVQSTVSERQTVYGGIDAIAHVLETYFDGASGVEIQKEYCEGLVRGIMRLVPKLRREPDNYDARSQLAWAATCALNGSTWVGHPGRGDFSSHVMGHVFSANYDSTHGATLAVIMPGWLRYVYKADEATFVRFAENVFGIRDGKDEGKIFAGIDRLKRFFLDQGAPSSLRELGVPEDALPRLAESAVRNGPIGVLRKLERDDVLNIFNSVY